MNQTNGVPIEPDACSKAAVPEGSLGRVLSDLNVALNTRPEAEFVLVRNLVAAMERNSFPLLLLLFSLLLVSPLSAVPGATSLFGLTIAAILTQRLLGRSQVWLPAILLARRLPARRTEQALAWLRRPVGWLDGRLVQQRQRLVLDAPFAKVPCQRRLNFPQKCRSKIPQFLGAVISRAGDRPSRFSVAARDVWAAVAA